MKFKIIYADCPWQYRDKALAGNRGAGCKYQVQSLEWLKSLPVNKIADENCFLFTWATFPMLKECFEVIDAWGFIYKTIGFNWIKTNKKSNTLFWGMGNMTRGNGEVCLLSTKGKPKRVDASVHSVVVSKIEGHSKKPDIVRNRIVKLCGDIPRIELFARQIYKGWTCLGNEIDGKDIKERLYEIIRL